MYSEIMLGVGVLGVILYGVYRPIYRWSVMILIVYTVSLVGGYATAEAIDSFYMVGKDEWVRILQIIAGIGLIGIVLMWERRGIELVLMMGLGTVLLISSVNWLSIYLAMELQTLSLFVLVALKRDSVYSTEAGLKYFVLGAISTGLFLLGCAMLYGASGEMSVQGVNTISETTWNFQVVPTNHWLISGGMGKALITISLLFKLSAAPFHMWAPDVYEGAPTTTTALLATVPKIGVFAILVQIGPLSNIVFICAIMSMIWGALGALNQSKIKRLLAYSGIGHMGFVLFGVGMGTLESIQASLIYMVIYVAMSVCVFSIILSTNERWGLVVDLHSLSRKNPILGVSMALVFLSIAGVPPLSGFLSKWFILWTGVSNGYYLICVVAVLSSVVAGVYYVRIVQMVYADYHVDLGREGTIDLKRSVLIGSTLYLVLFILICPNFLLQVTHDAAVGLWVGCKINFIDIIDIIDIKEICIC